MASAAVSSVAGLLCQELGATAGLLLASRMGQSVYRRPGWQVVDGPWHITASPVLSLPTASADVIVNNGQLYDTNNNLLVAVELVATARDKS